MDTEKLLDGIDREILTLLGEYVAVPSVTDSEGENDAASFFTRWFAASPYFAAHPEWNGSIPLHEGHPGRSARFALYRGARSDTVVMLHHFDVVPPDDYDALRPLAYDPAALTQALAAGRAALEPEVREDLDSGNFLFGHGVCDMKGGGAIQMALLRRLAESGEYPGSLLVLGVPDEENLSAGMRGAVTALRQLGERFGLHYTLAVNSEPHQRKQPDTGVFSTGSIGKLLPFVCVRGHMAHAGKVLEGLNPAGIMGGILTRTEARFDFLDNGARECAPPPTWLFVKDSKQRYDVSMPRTMFGCLNALLLDLPVEEVMARLRAVCRTAFEEALATLGESRRRYEQRFGRQEWPRFVPQVLSFGELLALARTRGGEELEARWQAALQQAGARLNADTMAQTQRDLTDLLLDALGDDEPRVIYGLMPPYYPAVCAERFPDAPERLRALDKHLAAYAARTWGQRYDSERYFTGLCDLSYSSWRPEAAERALLAAYMPLWGHGYQLPFDDMAAVSMPCLNIGPWGKDFHKLTERVCLTDLLERTPRLLLEALRVAAQTV